MSFGLPSEEVGEGEGGSAELAVEPAAEVVKGNVGSEASVEAVKRVWALVFEPEGAEQFGVNGLNDLAEAAVPTAQGGGQLRVAER